MHADGGGVNETRHAGRRERGAGKRLSRDRRKDMMLEHKCTDLRNVNGTRGHRISFRFIINAKCKGVNEYLAPFMSTHLP